MPSPVSFLGWRGFLPLAGRSPPRLGDGGRTSYFGRHDPANVKLKEKKPP